jgi:hypothetical protein
LPIVKSAPNFKKFLEVSEVGLGFNSHFQLSVTTLFAGLNSGNDPQVLFPKMSGRVGGRKNGPGGRGHGGRGRGQNNTGSSNTTKKGLCGNLGTNVFDYGQKSAADLMRTSWENLVQYVGNNYGQDISDELQNTITVDIIEPVHSAEVLRKHGLRKVMIRSGQQKFNGQDKPKRSFLKPQYLRNILMLLWSWQSYRMRSPKDTFRPEMKSQWDSTTLRRLNSVTNGAPFRNATPL